MWIKLLEVLMTFGKKFLQLLGIGFLSYEGVTILTNSLIAQVQAAWGGLTGSALQILSLAGVPESLGIICGALVARASLVAVGKLGKVAA